MATGNKKSTSGKRKAQTSRKGSTGRKKKTAAQQQEDFTREVILWIIVAVSILLFISNFGIGGTIGNAVSRFFFGVMGLIAYVFPVLLLVGTFFAVSNRGNRVATVKLVAMILFDLFLCMLIELLTKGSAVDGAAAAYSYSFEHRTGGGFIGGLLAWIFCPNFGLAGSYVIDAIMLIISLVLITERSALRGMQKGGKKVYESARSGNERHKERVRIQREEREQRREEQALRRMDRKVEGVAIDTRVLPRQNVIEHSDEISELNAEDYLEMPEVREEKIVPLTSDGGYPPAENLTPSAFSDEALAAVTPEASQNISAWTPETEDCTGSILEYCAGGSIVGCGNRAGRSMEHYSLAGTERSVEQRSRTGRSVEHCICAGTERIMGQCGRTRKRMGGGCAESTAERAAGSIGSRIARRDKGCVRHRGKCRTYHICTCGIR